jgi:hypothetical protein
MIKSIKYEEIVYELNKTIEWMESLEVRVSKHSRIQQILSLAKQLALVHKKRTLEDIEEKKKDLYIAALLEADDYIVINRALYGRSEQELIEKLSKAINGSFPEKEETTDTTARDALFELVFAAILKDSGLELIGFDDSKVNFQGRNVLFECKRLSSQKEGRVEENIETALAQLTRKLDKGEFGVVVLSIEKNMKMFGRNFKQFDENDLRRLQVEVGNIFFGKYRPFIEKRTLNINILGYIAINRSGHIVDVYPNLVKAKFFTFFPTVDPIYFQLSEYNFFIEFKNHLEKKLILK